MTNLKAEGGDYIAAGFLNSSSMPNILLQNTEPLLKLLSASISGSYNFEGNSYDLGINDGEDETQMGSSECLECESNLYVGAASKNSIGNQSELPDSTGLEVTTGFHLTNDGEDNDQLFVLPWSIITLWCFLYIGISLAAIIGNSLVMWVVSISRAMRNVTNMFIANLALADFIIGLFTIPFNFQAALFQRWDLPEFMCAFCPFVQVLSVNVSVFTLSAIAVDRYRAVLHPLSPRVSKRKAVWAIVGIWTASIVLALPTHLDYKLSFISDTENGGTKPFCSNVGLSVPQRMYYSLCLLVIQYVFPLIILTGAYTRMTTVLWGTAVPGNKEESRDAVVLRNKKKVIKMLAVVVILFAVCWLPLQLYNVLQIFFPSINGFKYINIIWFCINWLAMSNSCCNPFIYAIYNDKFQCEFRRRLFQKRLGRICQRNQKQSHDPEICSVSDIDGIKLECLKNDLNLAMDHQNEGRGTNLANTPEFNQDTNGTNSKRCVAKDEVYMDTNLYTAKDTVRDSQMKSMKNESDNSVKVTVATQIALKCQNRKFLRDSGSVEIVTRVVGNDKVTQV